MDRAVSHYNPRQLLRFPRPLRNWLSSDHSVWPLFDLAGFHPGVHKRLTQPQGAFGVPSAKKKTCKSVSLLPVFPSLAPSGES